MKNIFDYANKELSQDAFLRWLFESYSDNDLHPVVGALLRNFCNLEDDEQINKIETWSQWVKIDLPTRASSSGHAKGLTGFAAALAGKREG